MRAKLTTTPAVETPSATWLLLAKMSANASPWPSLTPTDLQPNLSHMICLVHFERAPLVCQGWADTPLQERVDVPVARQGPVACQHDVAEAR